MKIPHFAFLLIANIAFMLLPAACSSRQPATEAGITEYAADADAQDLGFKVLGTAGQALDPAAAFSALSAKQVIFIGENHERYDHHLNQLTILKRLYRADPTLAIGLEMFQQPAQPYLDAYSAGRLDEPELLEKTGYFEQWGYDYRLYRPILRYARQQGIPLLALNVPTAISRQVGRAGIASLSAEQRRWVPDTIDRTDSAYRDRLRNVYDQHRGLLNTAFEHFLEAQLLWDEAMAERAARYLKAHPDRRLVILAGNGHLAFGAGIPKRLQRRLPVATAIVLQEDAQELQGADYRLASTPLALPPAGRLGLLLDAQDARQGLKIHQVLPDSGAYRAGIQDNDRLVGIQDRRIRSMVDVRLALLDKQPGETLPLTLLREQGPGFQEIALTITLQE